MKLYIQCSIMKNVTCNNDFKGILSPRTKHLKTPKLDKCDQYLKCLANPELVYHNYAEDPFLKLYVKALYNIIIICYVIKLI